MAVPMMTYVLTNASTSKGLTSTSDPRGRFDVAGINLNRRRFLAAPNAVNPSVSRQVYFDGVAASDVLTDTNSCSPTMACIVPILLPDYQSDDGARRLVGGRRIAT